MHSSKITVDVLRQVFIIRESYANLEDSYDRPEKGVEIFPAAVTESGRHFAAVALATAVRFQRTELPAEQIHS